jgi:hypothetical protein
LGKFSQSARANHHHAHAFDDVRKEVLDAELLKKVLDAELVQLLDQHRDRAQCLTKRCQQPSEWRWHPRCDRQED